MDVDDRPNEIVRLCPKLEVAAWPEYVIDVRPAEPVALIAASMTAFASCASATPGSSIAATSAITPGIFRMWGHAPTNG